MIWFACKSCGKVHGRSDTSAGSMVFCDCGEGLVVPWESTVAEPSEPTVPPPLPAAIPTLEPISFDVEAPSAEPVRRRKRRDDRCLNHEDAALHAKCADCAEPFCSDCLVVFQGVALCGPCKNFRVRALQTPARPSGWAIASLVLALISCFFVCLVPATGTLGGLFVLAPQLAAFLLGGMALHHTEARPHVSGQWLAITAMVTATVVTLITLSLMFAAANLGNV